MNELAFCCPTFLFSPPPFGYHFPQMLVLYVFAEYGEINGFLEESVEKGESIRLLMFYFKIFPPERQNHV